MRKGNATRSEVQLSRSQIPGETRPAGWDLVGCGPGLLPSGTGGGGIAVRQRTVSSGKGTAMRVIWPDELDGFQDEASEQLRVCTMFGDDTDRSGAPAILPFPGVGRRFADVEPSVGFRSDEQSPADRARLIRRNSLCNRCHRTLVSLILADDGRRDGTGDFVPGSQTLIGFRCECCHSEWPARKTDDRPVVSIAALPRD